MPAPIMAPTPTMVMVNGPRSRDSSVRGWAVWLDEPGGFGASVMWG